MKRKLIFLLLFGFINSNLFLFAQHNERRRAEFEEFKQKRVEFITKAMDLNADEDKAFWPLYNELQDKKFELNQQFRKALNEFRGSEKDRKKHTEAEYKDFINQSIQFREKEIQIDEEYIAKFATVISYEKIFRYQQAEQQFARQMLNQRGERGNTDNNK